MQTEDFIGAFDIIHAHDWLAANAMIWLKQWRGHRTVFTVHSTEYGRCGNNFSGGQSALIRNIKRAATYWADRVTTVSKTLRNEVMWMYEVPDWKVSVSYNGVNQHRFDGWVTPGWIKEKYGIRPMDPTVLFCGRMVYQKGPDLLVEAIPALLRYYPRAKFVFVGDGEMREQVQRRAYEMGISHATRFLGNRSGWDLIDLYRACDLVCVPSEFVWHEVNGLKIYPHPESIAWGVSPLDGKERKAGGGKHVLVGRNQRSDPGGVLAELIQEMRCGMCVMGYVFEHPTSRTSLRKHSIIDIGKNLVLFLNRSKPCFINHALINFLRQPVQPHQVTLDPGGGILGGSSRFDHERPVAGLREQELPRRLPERARGNAACPGVAPGPGAPSRPRPDGGEDRSNGWPH